MVDLRPAPLLYPCEPCKPIPIFFVQIRLVIRAPDPKPNYFKYLFLLLSITLLNKNIRSRVVYGVYLKKNFGRVVYTTSVNPPRRGYKSVQKMVECSEFLPVFHPELWAWTFRTLHVTQIQSFLLYQYLVILKQDVTKSRKPTWFNFDTSKQGNHNRKISGTGDYTNKKWQTESFGSPKEFYLTLSFTKLRAYIQVFYFVAENTEFRCT